MKTIGSGTSLTLGCEGEPYWWAVARVYARLVAISWYDGRFRFLRKTADRTLQEISDVRDGAGLLALLRDDSPELEARDIAVVWEMVARLSTELNRRGAFTVEESEASCTRLAHVTAVVLLQEVRYHIERKPAARGSGV